MDRNQPFKYPPRDLYGMIGTGAAPLAFDVRRITGLDAEDRLLVGALSRRGEPHDRNPAAMA